MGNLKDINWDLLKFEYEVLGTSLEDLQEKYDVSQAMMQYSAKTWVQAPVTKREALQFTKLDSLTELSEDVAAKVAEESAIVSTIKQKYLLPKYIQLENILVTKAISLASSLTNDKVNASTLSTLTNILNNLLTNNPLLTKTEAPEAEVQRPQKWEIEVVHPTIPPPSSTEATPVHNDEETL